jgi:3-oxoadipate enol-lactonase
MRAEPAPADVNLRCFGSPDAPPLLLLHPIATDGELWRLQIPILARNRYLIVPDLPGHGASAALPGPAALSDYAEALLQAIAPMQLATFSVAGLSFGGMVAQALALAVPERVQRLVLAHCGAATPATVVQIWQQRLQAAAEGGMASQVAPTLERWFTPEFRANAPATCAWVGQMIADSPLGGYAAAVQAICGLDHAARLTQLQIPTLVIAGGRDAAVPPQASAALAVSMPRASFMTFPEAAHLGNIEQSQRFTETLDSFLPARNANQE